jgi:hypothetical protein
VTVVVDRAGGVARVPLELDARGAPQFVSVLRVPGAAAQYTMEVANKGFVRVAPTSDTTGASRVYVSLYDVLEDELATKRVVVTAASETRVTRQQPVRRLGPGRFVADVDLARGRNTLGVVARAADGSRLRSTIDLDVPRA